MSPSKSLNSCLCLIFALLCISSVGCGPDFGEKLEIKSTEIYYKNGATVADAKRLGEKLEQLNFIDGKSKSVQLQKRDDVIEFRMAIGKGGDTEAAKKQMKFYCLEVSSAFDGAPVEVHICNAKLESQTVVKGLQGKCFQLEKRNYFYDGIDLAKVKEFSGMAYATLIDTGPGANFHLSKSGSKIEIRVGTLEANQSDQKFGSVASEAAVTLSNQLFDGEPVDVLVCDLMLDSPKVFSSVKKAAAPATP